MSQRKRSWEKRLSGGPHALTVDFVESLSFDKRLYKYDIVGSIAHAQMLAEQKLITKAELREIKSALIEIGDEIATGRFKFDPVCEDIHMAIEAALIRRIGDAGKKLHTGRSRNDQVVTDLRLWVRDQTELLQARITVLQKALVKLAGEYAADPMPAYTHLQRAQPIVIASYLLSFVEPLQRDYVRLGNCRALTDVCPLGSGAVAGSTLPLDRKSTAEQLGFASMTYNSIDAVSDRDFCADFVFDCALIAAHLSRLAEDWILYSSTEFGFVRIDDSFCTSSSMMPQKRNPDVLELVRGKTGTVYGALVGLLTILKAQPSGYNRDLQEDKIHVFAAGDAIERSLEITAALVDHTRFNAKHIATGMDAGFLDATALAEYLVGKGVPFRVAHGVVGGAVAQCEKAGKRLSDLSLQELQEHCSAIESDVYDFLGAANVTRRYVTEGAAGSVQATQQLAYWSEQLAKR